MILSEPMTLVAIRALEYPFDLIKDHGRAPIQTFLNGRHFQFWIDFTISFQYQTLFLQPLQALPLDFSLLLLPFFNLL